MLTVAVYTQIYIFAKSIKWNTKTSGMSDLRIMSKLCQVARKGQTGVVQASRIYNNVIIQFIASQWTQKCQF